MIDHGQRWRCRCKCRCKCKWSTATSIASVLALVLVAAAQPGCNKRQSPPPAAAPPPPVLGPVVVEDATRPDDRAADLDLVALRDGIGARLVATGLAAPAPDGGSGGGATLRAGCQIAATGAEVDDKGIARVILRLRLQTRPSGAPSAVDEDLRGQGERTYAIRRGGASLPPSKSGLFTQLALGVAGDLIGAVAAREKLRTASPAAVHAAIRGDAGDLREDAIRIAGQRKLRQEVPALIELLEDPTESVRDAALGALMAIGDRRAVTALAKSRSFRDHREMRKILEAIATLGGDEALDYLSFVAETHDDPEIRDMAKVAKQRLERRRGAGKPGLAGE